MTLPPSTCHYCDRPATVFCDFVVTERPELPHAIAAGRVATCDRAICNEHRRKVGHLCYRGRNKKLSDSVDYCTEHLP